MKSINDFVEATLNVYSAENNFKEELVDILELNPDNVKSISLKNYADDTKLIQTIVVELIGRNHLTADNVAKIQGLTIITPSTIEIDVGEIDL